MYPWRKWSKMGKVRQFSAVLVLILFLQRAALGQQPIHWDATIDSAKTAAHQSNRLVLLLFTAPWCTHCHHLENEIRNQPGAVAALEADFVPVKINFDYYPNTAKQYGVTRLPTTVILAPDAKGEVLAVIPESMPVDQYLSKLKQVATVAKKRDAGVFAQIAVNPPVGSAAVASQSPIVGISPPAVPTAVIPLQSTAPQQPAGPVQNPPPPPTLPVVNAGDAARGGLAAPLATAPANPTTGPGASGGPPPQPQDPARNAKSLTTPLFGLDGFCPVQLVEYDRWQPGNKQWGVVHRGRIYLFAGLDEQRRFRANPDRYAPVSSGDDVVLLLEQGRTVEGYRQHGLKFEGHVYLFANEGTLSKFKANPHQYADRALQVIRSNQTASVR